MTNSDQITAVIILGTMHLSADHYPGYHERLETIIREIAPDVICAEVSPQQLAATCSCNSKPEERDVVMPLAAQLKTPIVPIQPSNDHPLAAQFDERRNAVIGEINSSPTGKYLLEYLTDVELTATSLWMEAMKDPLCIENVQLPQLHIQREAADDALARYLTGLARLYNEWNEYFLARIETALHDNVGRRLLVIAGLGHKHWLWNRLRRRDDIRLHDLQSFREWNHQEQR